MIAVIMERDLEAIREKAVSGAVQARTDGSGLIGTSPCVAACTLGQGLVKL